MAEDNQGLFAGSCGCIYVVCPPCTSPICALWSITCTCNLASCSHCCSQFTKLSSPFIPLLLSSSPQVPRIMSPAARVEFLKRLCISHWDVETQSGRRNSGSTLDWVLPPRYDTGFWALGKCQDTAHGVGKHSLRCGRLKPGFPSSQASSCHSETHPEKVGVYEPSGVQDRDSQSPGHAGAAGSQKVKESGTVLGAW